MRSTIMVDHPQPADNDQPVRWMDLPHGFVSYTARTIIANGELALCGHRVGGVGGNGTNGIVLVKNGSQF